MDKKSPVSHAAATSPLYAQYTPKGRLSRALPRILGTLFIVGAALLCGAILFRAPTDGLAKETSDGEDHKEYKEAALFGGWRTPDLALVLSGQAMGYLQPCGCSSPQYGGLSRRHNFIKSLKDKGWPVVAIDLGDNVQGHGRQDLLKYGALMRSLKAMGYGVAGLGKNEYLMPLHTALSEHTITYAEPRIVATDLNNTEAGKIWNKMNVRPTELLTQGVFRIGVISLMSTKAQAELNALLPVNQKADINFREPAVALTEGLATLKNEKANVAILLFHGDEDDAAKAAVQGYKLYKAGQAPLLHAIVRLDKFTDPPALPVRVQDGDKPIPTQIISVGQKGKHVGVLGFFRNPKNLEMRYQLAKMGPELQPKDGDEKFNDVLKVMQDYSDTIKKHKFLETTTRNLHPVQVARPGATYVGSEACKSCHPAAFKVWKDSGHSHAYQTLVDTKFPTGRQYDPECIQCHTVGFPFKSGFADPPGMSDAKAIADHNLSMRNVGCESCHGPCSDHVEDTKDVAIHKLINPYGPKAGLPDPRRKQLIEWNLCQKCHDEENDVHWGTVGFDRKWAEVAHPTPRKKGGEKK